MYLRSYLCMYRTLNLSGSEIVHKNDLFQYDQLLREQVGHKGTVSQSLGLDKNSKNIFHFFKY